MAEVLFYHLTRSPLERTLPGLAERTLARGWSAVVRAPSPGDLDRIDTLLWTYDEASFLPHGRENGAEQPVCLTAGTENPRGAEILFLVEGARLDPAEAAGWQRVCLLFDGHDAARVAAAREDWRAVDADPRLDGTYWAEEDGRWVRKAATKG